MDNNIFWGRKAKNVLASKKIQNIQLKNRENSKNQIYVGIS